MKAPDDSFEVKADPVKIRQVVDNLLSNAIKFSPSGAKIILELWHDKDHLCVGVLDEGPGLSPDDLEKAFSAFTPLSAKPTAGESSHGLGLSIVKRIVEQHAGKIWAENRNTGGAQFAFMLPTPQESSGSCNVLVVDDQALNRRLAGKLLERGGHTVDYGNSGEEALAAVESKDFDLLLLDVEMPGMNGLEVTRQIRARGKDQCQLPIIAMTGHSDPSFLSKCLDIGMNDTVTKPVDSGILDRLLDTWVPGKRNQPHNK